MATKKIDQNDGLDSQVRGVEGSQTPESPSKAVEMIRYRARNTLAGLNLERFESKTNRYIMGRQLLWQREDDRESVVASSEQEVASWEELGESVKENVVGTYSRIKEIQAIDSTVLPDELVEKLAQIPAVSQTVDLKVLKEGEVDESKTVQSNLMDRIRSAYDAFIRQGDGLLQEIFAKMGPMHAIADDSFDGIRYMPPEAYSLVKRFQGFRALNAELQSLVSAFSDFDDAALQASFDEVDGVQENFSNNYRAFGTFLVKATDDLKQALETEAPSPSAEELYRLFLITIKTQMVLTGDTYAHLGGSLDLFFDPGYVSQKRNKTQAQRVQVMTSYLHMLAVMLKNMHQQRAFMLDKKLA